MKKLFIILLAVTMVALPSCKNQKKEAQAPVQKELTQKEQYILAELELNATELAESFKNVKKPAFADFENGEIVLTEKEKMVKPDYLLDPSIADSFVTLEQKYRGIGMFSADKAFASLYDMSTDNYQKQLSKLVTEISDPAVEKFFKSDYESDAVKEWYETETTDGRLPLFWNMWTASLVEEVFLLTRNPDKIMTIFDDESASDISYRFILVHNGLTQVVEIYPEMASLNAVLEPLYVINAINVEQLRDQILELKGEIETVRAYLLQ